MKSIRDVMLNPYWIYSISMSIALVFFALGWIDYPNISFNVSFFLLATIIVSFFLGFTVKKEIEVHFDFNEKKIWTLSLSLSLFVCLGAIATFIHAQCIPLYSILFSPEDYNYRYDFHAIKYFTLLVTSLNSTLVLMFSFFWFVYKKKRYIGLTALSLFITLLFGSRGMLLVTVVPACFLVLYYIPFNLKNISFFVLMFIGGSYLFGWYGDQRETAKFRENVSLYENMHNEYYPSFLAEEFMWFYMYISSPIAKFQYVTEDTLANEAESDFCMMFVSEMLPYSISKRLVKGADDRVRCSNHGLPFYFVGTAYDDVYLYGKWKGVYLYALGFFLFIFLLLSIVRRWLSFLLLPVSAVLCFIALCSLFDNMLCFSPVMFMLYWLGLFGLGARLQKVKLIKWA